MPVSREDDVVAAVAQQREHVTRVHELVAIPPRAGDGDEVVMAHEHAQVGGTGEALGDPGIVLAADLAFVEVGLRAVDCDDRDVEPVELHAMAGIAGPEGVLEPHVADVARIVIAGHEHDVRAREPGERSMRVRILVAVAVVGDVARDDDEVGLCGVDLVDRNLQEIRPEPGAADVDVRDLGGTGNGERASGARPCSGIQVEHRTAFSAGTSATRRP